MIKNCMTIAALLIASHAVSQINVSTGIGNTSVNGGINLPKIKREKKEKKEETIPAPESPKENGGEAKTESAPAAAAPKSLKTYANYDFVAGSRVIFEDDFTSDADAEFPAHWKLEKGQAIINQVDSKPTFCITDGNYAIVTPRIKSSSYLGNAFTIEYDVYYGASDYGLMVFFMNGDEEVGSTHMNTGEMSLSFPDGHLDGSYPKALSESFTDRWHHVAIAYKDKQVKMYCDQYRVLVVPDCNFTATSVKFGGIGQTDAPMKFTNVRINDGAGMNMLQKVAKDGRFVTHGILFDSGKSVIKPESMGTLNDIANALKQEKEMKFEIGGHTDSDGDDASNMKLSQARAEAVKAQLVQMGVSAEKLTCKGYGETKPIDNNTTPEGKANNRRVEFVKS